MDKRIIVASTPDGRDSWFYRMMLEVRRHPDALVSKVRNMGAGAWELTADALAHAAAIEATVSGFAMYQLPHPMETEIDRTIWALADLYNVEPVLGRFGRPATPGRVRQLVLAIRAAWGGHA